jgi:hypothetical protein
MVSGGMDEQLPACLPPLVGLLFCEKEVENGMDVDLRASSMDVDEDFARKQRAGDLVAQEVW